MSQIVIGEAWCLHFGILGDYCGTLGDLGSNREDTWGPLGCFVDPILKVFWAPSVKNLFVVSDVIFMSLFTPTLSRNPDSWGFRKSGFRVEGIAKNTFSQVSLFS